MEYFSWVFASAVSLYGIWSSRLWRNGRDDMRRIASAVDFATEGSTRAPVRWARP